MFAKQCAGNTVRFDFCALRTTTAKDNEMLNSGDKVYLIEQSYMRDDYDGSRYRWEEVYVDDEVVYPTREAAQARCDELNEEEYIYRKNQWEGEYRRKINRYSNELEKYNVLSEAGIAHPRPQEPIGTFPATIEEWRADASFDGEWYTVVEWELK